jgi:uncharacterized protein (TIGR00369 family)
MTTLTAADIQQTLASSPFIAFMKLRVLVADPEKQVVVMVMPQRPEFERRQGSGQFHGGPLAAFIDTVGDYAIAMMVNGGVPTINFRVDYLRPAINTSVKGIAQVRRIGRTVSVVDVDVVDEAGRLVAIGRGTYSSQPA